MDKPRVLLFDIETAPNIMTLWGLKVESKYIHPQNIVSERYILSIAWKWEGEKKVFSADILSHPGSKKHPDKGIIREFLKVWNKADAVVAHFGDKFDIPWVRARAIITGFPSLKPVIPIDTKKISSSKFYFNAHKLDYLGELLGLGRKVSTNYGLWTKCMSGNKRAVREMVAYNKQDVILLEKIFLKLRPFVTAKLNKALFINDEELASRTCPSCGKPALIARGRHYTRTQVRNNYRCTDCGAWSYKLTRGVPR